MMTIRTLEHIPFASLMEAFLLAFENYFVTMPTDHEYYRTRWDWAKVSYSDSYGMFDNDKLVAFIIHAVDQRNGDRIAFNSGTGVLPEYRGQRMVQKLYNHCIPALKKKGITLLALEVIIENERAIKAYERVGFSITKRYKCYSGAFQVENNTAHVQCRQVSLDYLNWDSTKQSYYSWDHHITTLLHGEYDCYLMTHKGVDAGYFIIDSKSGYIAQFDVFQETTEQWDALFSSIKKNSKTIRINNVDERLTSKIRYLEKIGLTNTVDQYEMEMRI